MLAYIYLIIIIIGIPVVILFAYKKLYSKYVNKRLKDKSYNLDGQEGRIPDSHTGAKVIIIMLLFGSLSSVQSRISDVKDMMNSQRSSLVKRLDGINERLDEMEEVNEKASRKNDMVSELDVTFGELGDDHRTANFIFDVTLKNYDKDSNYYLLVGKEKTKVELSEDETGDLKGSVDLDIFGEYGRIVCVKQDSEGNKENEKIVPNDDWTEDTLLFMNFSEDGEDYFLYTKFLLETCYWMSKEEWKTADGEKIKMDASICASLEEELSDNGIKEAKVYIEADGEVIDEKNLDKKKLYSDDGCRFKYEKKIEGKIISIYYKITDSYGYSFKGYLWSNDDKYDSFDGDGVIVSDENDKQIYEKLY